MRPPDTEHRATSTGSADANRCIQAKLLTVPRLRRLGFLLATLTPLRKYLYHRYEYSFSPSQLCFLVRCLNDTAMIHGSIMEIGCAYGHTTVFLERHLRSISDTRAYFCIDTFEGFTLEDTVFEKRVRGKSSTNYHRSYADVSLTSFQRTLANNGVSCVEAIKADIKSYDLEPVGIISFCLIDVDLYLPVKAALDKVIGLMSPGGMIVIDDCKEHPMWDGALQAYEEFTSARKIEAEIVEGQFGIIRC